MAAVIGLAALTLLPAGVARAVEELRVQAPVAAVQVVLNGRQDVSPTSVAVREPAAAVFHRPRGDVSATARSASDASSGEPRTGMLLLAAAALIMYVIGRRGLQRY